MSKRTLTQSSHVIPAWNNLRCISEFGECVPRERKFLPGEVCNETRSEPWSFTPSTISISPFEMRASAELAEQYQEKAV